MTDERCIICGETEGNGDHHPPSSIHTFVPQSTVSAPSKVWLVWTGEYADASVVGVYSSEELANAAAKLFDEENRNHGPYRVSIEERAVDENSDTIRLGVARWRVEIDLETGEITWWIKVGPGTGEPTQISTHIDSTSKRERIIVYADAKERGAVEEIAMAERAQRRTPA